MTLDQELNPLLSCLWMIILYTMRLEVRPIVRFYKRILMQFSVGHRNGIHVSLNFSSGLSMGVLSRQKPEHILLSFVPT